MEGKITCPDCGNGIESVFGARTRVRDGRVTATARCQVCDKEIELTVKEDPDWLPEDYDGDITGGFRLASRQEDTAKLVCPECNSPFDGAAFNKTTQSDGKRVETFHECPDCQTELVLSADTGAVWVPDRLVEDEEVASERLFARGMKRIATGVFGVFISTVILVYTSAAAVPESLRGSPMAALLGLVVAFGMGSVLYSWYGLSGDLEEYFSR